MCLIKSALVGKMEFNIVIILYVNSFEDLILCLGI